VFKNASGNGADGWKNLSYSDFAHAMALGRLLNPFFGNLDTNNPDLTEFRESGGKMITFHGMADALVSNSSTVDYYNRSAAVVGGLHQAQKFHRLFFEPGRGHCDSPAFGLPPGSNPPKLQQGSPGPDRERSALFDALVEWVENGKAPTTFIATSLDKKVSRPVCMYPQKLTYVGGDTNLASSYSCR
jgi:tannase/feruloyl esterase